MTNQLKRLCKLLSLGELVHPIIELPKGGHRTFKIETTQGMYAIKQYGYGTVKTEKQVQRTARSEEVALLVAQSLSATCNNFSVVHGIKVNGNIIHELDGEHYVVFNWSSGVNIQNAEIGQGKMHLLGSALFAIHSTDYSSLFCNEQSALVRAFRTEQFPIAEQNISPALDLNLVPANWDNLVLKLKDTTPSAPWMHLLEKESSKLQKLNKQSTVAHTIIAMHDIVVTHPDISPSNILWKDDKPHIIDWEYTGKGHVCMRNRMLAVLSSAERLSRKTGGSLDIDKVFAFIDGYAQCYKITPLFENYWELVVNAVIYKRVGTIETLLKRYLKLNQKRETYEIEKAKLTKHLQWQFEEFGKWIKSLAQVKKRLTETYRPEKYNPTGNVSNALFVSHILADYLETKAELQKLRDDYSEINEKLSRPSGT